MPSEDQLRTIAAASREEQAQVWKKHRPKKGHDFYSSTVARSLSKRCIPFNAARFDEETAHAYGIVWHDDLFAQGGEDGRCTTDVDAFFAAEQDWLAANLPPGGTLLLVGEYGQPQLPKKAQHVYGKPHKGDLVGHYLDEQSGEVKTITYRLLTKETAKSGQKDAGNDDGVLAPKTRPEGDTEWAGDDRDPALMPCIRHCTTRRSTRRP